MVLASLKLNAGHLDGTLVVRDHHLREVDVGITRHAAAHALLHALHGRLHRSAVHAHHAGAAAMLGLLLLLLLRLARVLVLVLLGQRRRSRDREQKGWLTAGNE